MAERPGEKPARRRRLSLRGLLGLVAVVALASSLILPRFGDRFRRFERFAWVKLNQDDLNRHANVGAVQGLAADFTGAIRSGHPQDAREMTTLGFQRRVTPDAFRAMVEGFGIDRGPCELVGASTSIPLGELQFLSIYQIRCVPPGAPARRFELVVVTEAGRLRVDRIEAGWAHEPPAP